MVIIHCKFYANWSTSSYFFALSKVVWFFFAIVRALQREALICKNAILEFKDCQTEMGKDFTQTIALFNKKR